MRLTEQTLDTCCPHVTLLPMAAANPEPLSFAEAGRVPAPGDNVAIAIRTLPAGSRVLIRQLVFELSHTILEGHRFALFRIRKGEPLLSWGLPFGLALRDIEPGEYVCNEKILQVLGNRRVDFKLPTAANFIDHRLSFQLDSATFQPGRQVLASPPAPTFQGFRRHPRRGAGTRNDIVILGVNSRTAAFARSLAARFRETRRSFSNIDAVVPVDHTEGGTAGRANNLELTIRTLAGFMVHPNVGAVLCVDYGPELLSNEALRAYLSGHGYPVEGLIHGFLSITDSYAAALDEGERMIKDWLPRVNQCEREALSVSHLRLGLQCGGSDAFSGVSGNPLVGLLARQTVAHGGSANLAETDELIGAESCVLSNVRDLATAQAFLQRVDRFQKWAALHGHTAEGNPSGGNMYRGLYNIAIKSIGAARKKDPATRLDFVIDYAERMSAPGFYFMDSPGNDLESIAGQVAAGCNMILFATGNGSITNFPFVPTIKIMTTTQRFDLVRNEMDFNAGRYQDGEPLEALGEEAFSYMLHIASGQPSAGEKAGHSQVQLWREWRNNPPINPGEGPELEFPPPGASHLGLAREIAQSSVLQRYALVLPTSLCSGQIALAIAEKLNRMPGRTFDRAVALPHTEGCGNSGGASEQLFLRTMAGYLAHPLVAQALLLEHGCEKTHNDAFRKVLRALHLPESHYGFASVQLDGGIDQVTAKALRWFHMESNEHSESRPGPLAVALHGHAFPDAVRHAFGIVTASLVAAGASVVLAEKVGISGARRLQYGERLSGAGLFVMACPTEDPVEIATGLAATGVQMLIGFEPGGIIPAHPLVPSLQIALRGCDADLLAPDSLDPALLAENILLLMAQVRRGERTPAAQRLGTVGFQITRGYEGISL